METRPQVRKIAIYGSLSLSIKDNGDIVSNKPAKFDYHDGKLSVKNEQSGTDANFFGSNAVGVHHGDIVHYHGDSVTYRSNSFGNSNNATMSFFGEEYRRKLLETPMGKMNYFVPNKVVLKWHGSELNVGQPFVIDNMNYYQMVTNSGRKIYVPFGFKLVKESALEVDESEKIFKANIVLEEINIQGASTLTICDPQETGDICRFKIAKNFTAKCSSATTVNYNRRSDFETLQVTVSGCSKFCAKRVSTHIFMVNISGSSNVEIYLVKELAKGSASGVSKVRFTKSSYIRQLISTSGLSKVVIN